MYFNSFSQTFVKKKKTLLAKLKNNDINQTNAHTEHRSEQSQHNFLLNKQTA
jgi:hypothetical protein